jgi:hypothetical protein
VVELNPAHVTAQQRVNGSVGVETDRLDLARWSACRSPGGPARVAADEALAELSSSVAHRRIKVRTVTRNSRLASGTVVPRDYRALRDVRGNRVGRLVSPDLPGPSRLPRLGEVRFRCVRRPPRAARVRVVATWLVQASCAANPRPEAVIAWRVLAPDYALLDELDT